MLKKTNHITEYVLSLGWRVDDDEPPLLLVSTKVLAFEATELDGRCAVVKTLSSRVKHCPKTLFV
jgi:hypothetical protein